MKLRILCSTGMRKATANRIGRAWERALMRLIRRGWLVIGLVGGEARERI